MHVQNDNISSSEFDDVDLHGTKFNNGNLSGSTFENVNLSRSRFHDINFSDVVFTAAQIGGTVFRHIGPPRAKDGTQPRQRPVTFEEMTLCDSVFRKVNLSNVQLIECNTTGMKIDGVLLSDLQAAYRKLNT
jgi:uncharacterized protein YjbI with pentapeptide repeats